MHLNVTVNGENHDLDLDQRTTLLDMLRHDLNLTGTKKGCDHGQCGACTVLVNGQRINACLALAVTHDGDEITTVEGLGDVDRLGHLQRAFISHDAFQCGFCTSGQLMSATAMLSELQEGWASHVSASLTAPEFTRAEIAERMSGNLCRCACYPGIVAAIEDVVADAVTAREMTE